MAVCFQMVWRKRKLFVLYFQLSCKFEIVLKKKLDFRVKCTVEPSLGLTSHLTHCIFVLGFFLKTCVIYDNDSTASLCKNIKTLHTRMQSTGYKETLWYHF